jgi:hypothetical protein
MKVVINSNYPSLGLSSTWYRSSLCSCALYVYIHYLFIYPSIYLHIYLIYVNFVWYWDLSSVLARQELYHLSYTPSPSDVGSHFTPGPAWTAILLFMLPTYLGWRTIDNTCSFLLVEMESHCLSSLPGTMICLWLPPE